MQALLAYAAEHSGIDKQESEGLDRLDLSLYDKIGREGISLISRRFYDSVYADELWFRSIFSASTKTEAVQNQTDFLIERLGGPPAYTERKGRVRLIGRHAPYELTNRAAERWIQHMEKALKEVPQVDEEARDLLIKYFRHTAHFLVAGVSFSNSTHLIDYHNKMAHSGGPSTSGCPFTRMHANKPLTNESGNISADITSVGSEQTLQQCPMHRKSL